MWVPTSINDFNHVMGGVLTGLPDLRFDFTERCDWTDLFGCVWEWVPSAGGSMEKPNHPPVLDDITEWEKKIVWPNLSEDRIKACCEKYINQPYYHSEKMNYYDIGMGCTERLVAVLGGYTEAMLALAEEPDACREFMCELSRFHCEMLDKIGKSFPTDMIMYHDDWGTERDAFFSEKMMDEIVYEPNPRSSSGMSGRQRRRRCSFHTCGCIKRFLCPTCDHPWAPISCSSRCAPTIVKAYKEKYGDQTRASICVHDSDQSSEYADRGHRPAAKCRRPRQKTAACSARSSAATRRSCGTAWKRCTATAESITSGENIGAETDVRQAAPDGVVFTANEGENPLMPFQDDWTRLKA